MKTVSLTDFSGGLNLRDKADTVQLDEAVDLLNVTFTEDGQVEQRPGYAAFTSSELTNRVDSLAPFYTTSGTSQLVAGCGTRLEALNTSGVVVASNTGLTSGPYSFVRFGTATNERMYCANGQDVLQRWDGSSWAAPTHTVDSTSGRTSPKPLYVCVQPKDNRLVAAGYTGTTSGPNGATSSYSYVYFSGAGDPETWTTTHYVQLTPNDGEKIQAAVTFRDSVYVFKETKFFVFYGNSTDSTGQPIFNYRTVDTGIGLASPRAITVTKEGIYFLGRNGVYFTSGSDPTRLSDVIEPFFSGNTNSTFNSDSVNQGSITAACMTKWNDRVYLAVPTGASTTNDRMLVYDPQHKWWSLYDITASALCQFRPSSGEELMFGYPAGSKYVGRHKLSYTSDAGTAIGSRWYSGWGDVGSGDVKRVRQAKVWGKQVILFVINRDFMQTAPASTIDFGEGQTWGDGSGSDTWGDGTGTDIWGPGPVAVPKMYRQAIRGTYFQVAVENGALDRQWGVNRVDLHVADSRVTEVVQTDT